MYGNTFTDKCDLDKKCQTFFNFVFDSLYYSHYLYCTMIMTMFMILDDRIFVIDLTKKVRV